VIGFPASMVAKADGNTLRTQRTRARVLAESLRLFNEVGEAHVTTGTVAAALGMSPGNLYYHFRNKDQIIEELFDRFEERVGVQPWRDALPGAPRDATPGPELIEDLWLYLHLMLECVWDYRFLYRSLDDLMARNKRLRDRFNRILDGKQATVVALCEGLVAAGAMRASASEISALARNVLVVATYWLNFQALRARRASSPSGDIGEGAYQVMALVAPYLVGAARSHLDRLGRTYID
jgi:AcrR family transcriptional regulator